MEISYTRNALEDLRRIPMRFARQNVTKVARMEAGPHGDIKRLTNFDCDYRLRCGDCWVLSTLKKIPSSYIVFCTAPMRMTKDRPATPYHANRPQAPRSGAPPRRPGDMLDHLAVIEARAKFNGEKRFAAAEVRKALDL
ncbi:MAG: hypothetical protein ABI946_02755 [Chthoniobacterales bacterium]